MKQQLILPIFYICIIILPQLSKAQEYVRYPETLTTDQENTFFGNTVKDPYRWLEKNDEKTNKWVEAQQKSFEKYAQKVLRNKTGIADYLQFLGSAYYKPYIKKGNKYFSYRYDHRYSSPSLYVQDSINSNAVLAINPIHFKEKNETLSLMGFEVSKNNKYLACELSRSGMDWREYRIKDLENDTFLDDEIRWSKYGKIEWQGDGFYYIKFNKPKPGNELSAKVLNQKLFYHEINTDQKDDKLIFELPANKYDRFAFDVSSDERYLFIEKNSNKNGEWVFEYIYKDLEKNDDFRNLFNFPKDNTYYEFLDHIDDKIYFKTNINADNGKVVSLDMATLEFNDVLPENAGVLEKINIIGNKFVALYFLKGQYTLLISQLDGKIITYKEFEVGKHIVGLDGNNNDTETMYYKKSFFIPPVVYKLNLETNKEQLISKTKITYDHTEYETKYLSYQSKDGTWIPIYLTYKKGTKLSSGENPVLLYGYGGFGVSLTPNFDPGYVMFMKSGGVLATPQIRGGGEFGDEWHDAGRRLNKQNSFDDFIAAAELLINVKVTNKNLIAINGGSNGGLLVGAVMTQRPDLFKVAVPEMGVFDMLRFQEYGLGHAYKNEFGSRSDSIEFENLLSYSPVHNVKSKTDYPATLIITASNDDRVLPFNSYKFVSALQGTSTEKEPYFLYVQDLAGHYGATTLGGQYATKAIKYSFIFKHLNMKLDF